MSKLSRLEQILDVKSRIAPVVEHVVASQIIELHKSWIECNNKIAFRPYIPIRIVTIIEIFVKSCIAQLIDHGSPYIERSISLSTAKSLKLDFAISMAIQNKAVSLGEIVAHEVSITSLENIESALSTLIGGDLFSYIANVHDRWDVEILRAPQKPIIEDIRYVRAEMAKLFKVRHILVHEMPKDNHINDEDVSTFAEVSLDFINATNQFIQTLLRGNYPLTQADMNHMAGEVLQEKESILDTLINGEQLQEDDGFRALETEFKSYADACARWLSRIDVPMSGSMAPLQYCMARAKLIEQFIEIVKTRAV